MDNGYTVVRKIDWYYMDNNTFTSIEDGYCFYDFNGTIPRTPSEKGLSCQLSSGTNKKVLLFGDSFAGHFEPLFKQVGQQRKLDITSVTTNWCYPGLSTLFPAGGKGKSPDAQCQINRAYLKDHASDFDIIVLGGQWGSLYGSAMFDDTLNLIDFLAEKQLRVIILPSPTRFEFNIPKAWATAYKNHYSIDLENYVGGKDDTVKSAHQVLSAKADSQQDVFFIKREQLFNTNHEDEEDVPYSFDGEHINVHGAISLLRNFNKNHAAELFNL